VLASEVNSKFLVVPGSLLAIVEHIIKCSINSPSYQLKIDLRQSMDMLHIQYEFNDKIVQHFNLDIMKDVQDVYNIYSDTDISIEEINGMRQINIPKLITNT
jgi:hypothetical protein